jgi:catechol 2,3-dioxygenase-like lactoylglutathione lyase family enzyme
MTILAIDHVQLAMPAGAEAALVAFYCEVLGFSQVPKPAALAGRGGAWFQHGNVRIHLGVEADFRPARKAHPALLVAGLDQILARARAAGVEVDLSQPPLEGFRRAHLFDPCGNRIELMEARA